MKRSDPLDVAFLYGKATLTIPLPSTPTVKMLYSTSFGIATHHEGLGMPLMGSLLCTIDFHVDINDGVNMPFATLQALFELANIATKAKIKEIKIEFWQDESKTNAVCTYSFLGWINHFNISNSGEGNHILALSVQPALGKNNFYDISMGN